MTRRWRLGPGRLASRIVLALSAGRCSWPEPHPSHDWEFGAFGGGWAVYLCRRCGCSTLDGARWLRCRTEAGWVLGTAA